MALTAPVLVGAIAGTFLFNLLALWITRSWPKSASKILIIGVVMFFLLALGDNVIRGGEPLGMTFVRVGIAQAIVTFVLLIIELSRQSAKSG
jgi:peptidoglycan/LPS O-acetylase OafA/YrhL